MPVNQTVEKEFELRRIEAGIRRLEREGRKQVGKIGQLAEYTLEGALSDPDWQQFNTAVTRAERLASSLSLAKRVRKQFKAENRGEVVRVKSEPRIYSQDSPHSFFNDHRLAAVDFIPGREHDQDEARARLTRHAVELASEVRSNSTKRESRYVVQAARNISRKPAASVRQSEQEFRQMIETRAMSATTTSGLSFVTPQYLVDAYILWREFPPSLMLQLPWLDTPAYGLTVNVPSFNSSAAVAKQASDGQAPSEQDPTTAYLSANLSPFAGVAIISQQLYDRAGPDVSFDQAIYNQLRQEYDAAVDVAVANAALASATAFSRASYTNAGLWSDLMKARNSLETSAGTKLRPTAVFTTPTLLDWIFSQVDTTNARPLVTPFPATAVGPMRVGMDEDQPGGRELAGWSGYNLAKIAAFSDGNLPQSGSNAQIVVINGPSVMPILDAAPTLFVAPETFSPNLEVLVRLHGYAGVVVRRQGGVAVISGAAYPAAPTFA